MSEYKHPLGPLAELSEDDLRAFIESTAGDVLLPDDGYHDARSVWNGLINKYPALLVRVENSTDVATAIDFARTHDLNLSIRGGAHHQSGSAIADNGLVIDLTNLNEITVDPDDNIARRTRDSRRRRACGHARVRPRSTNQKRR